MRTRVLLVGVVMAALPLAGCASGGAEPRASSRSAVNSSPLSGDAASPSASASGRPDREPRDLLRAGSTVLTGVAERHPFCLLLMTASGTWHLVGGGAARVPVGVRVTIEGSDLGPKPHASALRGPDCHDIRRLRVVAVR